MLMNVYIARALMIINDDVILIGMSISESSLVPRL